MITDKRSHWSIEGFVDYSLDWGERVVRRREVNPSQISRQMQVLGMGGRYLQIFPRRYLQYLRTHPPMITSVKAKRLLEFCHRPGNGRTWMIRNFPKGNESVKGKDQYFYQCL